MRKARLEVSPAALLLWAALLLVLPLRWLLACAGAAAVHECCHILAVYLLDGDVQMIRIGPWGAQIRVGPMGPGRELVCALAGPVGALLLLPFSRWIPCMALCAAIQSAYNLLPVYPLDGGRALWCAGAVLLGEDIAVRLCEGVKKGFLICLFAAGIYGFVFLKLTVLPLIAALSLFGTVSQRKFPCKSDRKGLQ